MTTLIEKLEKRIEELEEEMVEVSPDNGDGLGELCGIWSERWETFKETVLALAKSKSKEFDDELPKLWNGAGYVGVKSLKDRCYG